MMDIESLIRPNIRRLKPYRSARHDFSSGILLDANENPFGSAVTVEGLSLNRYPDPYQRELRTTLAQFHGVRMDNIFVGVGSDEVIDLLLRVFCEPESESVMILEPTYGVYRVAADVNNVRILSCLLDDHFQIDVAAVKRTMESTTKLMFCCSPNNPTANLLRREDILELCASMNALIVVDEAYADYAQSPSLISEIERVPNLVVLRTLSKAWGLAAIRLGYAIAHPATVSYLMKVKAPYSINILTSTEALKALQDRSHVEKSVASTVAERERLCTQLAQFSFVEQVFPSDANFLLVRFTDARSVYDFLARRGIIVRDRSSEPKLSGCLRISVGTPEQNEKLLHTLKEINR